MKKLIVLFISSFLLFLAANLSVVRAQTSYIIDATDANGKDCNLIGNWVGGTTNTCTLNKDVGAPIQIISDGVTLDGNNIYSVIGTNSGGYGISLASRTKVTIMNLSVKSFDVGINLYNSPDNILENNSLSNNTSHGIVLDYMSNNNKVTGNTSSSNGNGISLYSSNVNIITNNTFSNGAYGIYLDYKLYPYPSGNEIYNNNFIGNTIQAEGLAGGNIFNKDKPIGGNYWSNFDTPGDGCHNTNPADIFCDNPYYGGQGVVDNFPHVCPIGTTPGSDETAPVTTATFSGTSGNNDWYVSNVLVTLSAMDVGGACGGGGTVESTEYSFDGATWIPYTPPDRPPVTISAEGEQTLYYRSTDGAGNVEPTKTQVLKIDKTAPQIVINKPQDGQLYILKQNVLADWAVSDATSGIASSSGTVVSGQPIVTVSVGTKTFSVQATDNAGNQNSQTHSYKVGYSYSGVLWPINNNGSSIFTLGWIIPVRFQLRDANNNFVSNAKAQLYLAKVINGVPGTPIAAVSALPRIYTGNEFRYSPLLREYNFYMATRSLSRGKWQLRIALDDGTSKTVNITLR